MAHCISPAFPLTVRFVSRTFAANPVTSVSETLSMTDASAPACGTDYSYTLGGKLATRTWARGIVTTYGYTPAGELALVDYADATPDIAYSYDRLGRQTQLTDGSGVRTFAYDPNTLRPVSETLAMSGAPAAVTLTRNRDAQGRYTGYALDRGNESLTSATYTFDSKRSGCAR